MNIDEKYLVLKGSHDLLVKKVERYEKALEEIHELSEYDEYENTLRQIEYKARMALKK